MTVSPAPTTRFYLLVLMAGMLSLLLAGAVLAYRVDPANLFHPGIEEKIAGLLEQGFHVYGVGDHDERALEKQWIQQTTWVPDLVVVGSSRSALIGERFFDGLTVRNHAVSGAVLEDYLGIVELYAERGQLPRYLMMGMNPWLLNPATRQQKWQTLSAEVNRMRVRLGLPEIPSETTSFRGWQLISLAYLQASWKRLKKGEGQVKAVQEADEQFTGLLSDGSMIYPPEQRQQSLEKLNQMTREAVNSKPIWGFEHFTRLDAGRQDMVERFTRWLVHEGVTPVFYLGPYYPEAWRLMSKSPDTRVMLQAEQWYRQLAEREGAIVIGSYDPARAACSADTFMDAVHPGEDCIRTVMTGLEPWLRHPKRTSAQESGGMKEANPL